MAIDWYAIHLYFTCEFSLTPYRFSWVCRQPLIGPTQLHCIRYPGRGQVGVPIANPIYFTDFTQAPGIQSPHLRPSWSKGFGHACGSFDWFNSLESRPMTEIASLYEHSQAIEAKVANIFAWMTKAAKYEAEIEEQRASRKEPLP